MTKKEKVFFNTIEELKTRIDEPSEYNILKSSGLIRILLVDGNSLVNQVNKEFRVKINFKVQQRFDIPEGEPLPNGVIPKPLFGVNFILPSEESTSIELLNIKEYFKYTVAFYEGNEFSVLDVIKICANKYGGVHLDDVKTLKEKFIDGMHNHFFFNDFSSVLHSMHSISIICLNSLLPLFNIIKEKYKIEHPINR